MTVPVLQVKNLYKLFIPLEHSQNEKKAMAMLEQGASRHRRCRKPPASPQV